MATCLAWGRVCLNSSLTRFKIPSQIKVVFQTCLNGKEIYHLNYSRFYLEIFETTLFTCAHEVEDVPTCIESNLHRHICAIELEPVIC